MIDSTVPDMWLPETWCDLFEDAFGLRYVEETGRYLVDDEQHTALQQLQPTLTFTLGASTNGGTVARFDLPYAAFDLEGQYPVFPNATRYFPIRRAANDSQYTIGRVFLQETYLTVDSERGIFNMSQARFANPMPSSDIVAILSPDAANSTENGNSTTSLGSEASGGGLSGGAIGGIVAGVVGALVILAGVMFWWFRRRRRNNQPRKWPDAEPAEQSTEAAPPPQYGGELIGSAANVPELSDGKARTDTTSPMSRHEAAGVTPVSEAGGREKYEAAGSTPFSEADGAQRFEAEGNTPMHEAAGTPRFEAEGDTPIHEADGRPRRQVHEAEGSTPVYELPGG